MKKKDIPKSFKFDAVEDNQLLTLSMSHLSNTVYYVDTNKHGKFFFRISRYDKKYIGNSKFINSEDKLYQVVPFDISKLESVCIKHKFFFVGKIDENIIG